MLDVQHHHSSQTYPPGVDGDLLSQVLDLYAERLRQTKRDHPPGLTDLPSDQNQLRELIHAIQMLQRLSASAYTRLSDAQSYTDCDIIIALTTYEAHLHEQITRMQEQFEELKRTDWHAVLNQVRQLSTTDDPRQHTLENILHLLFQCLYQRRPTPHTAQ